MLYGAPPLIAEKALQGEIDAALEFWNFAADLEAQGFTRAVELTDVEKALGAKGDVVVTGYVFDEDFAAKNRDALARFFSMTKKAKELIATSDKAWDVVKTQRLGGKDAKTVDIYRKRYVAGAPKRSVAQEEADARTLYGALAALGGEKLVGPARRLIPEPSTRAPRASRIDPFHLACGSAPALANRRVAIRSAPTSGTRGRFREDL